MGCPQKAIAWSNNFEHSVYRRATLVKQLNKEGSKLEEKKVVAPQQEEKKVINSNTNQQQ